MPARSDGSADCVNVTMPAAPEYLHVLRSVIGSIGALANAPIDVIEDLRLSVDEACSQLLASGLQSTLLRLEVARGDDVVEVVASVDAVSEAWPPAGGEDTLAWQILRALADSPRFEQTPAGVAIRFAKRLSP